MQEMTDVFTKEKTISFSTAEDMAKFALGVFDEKDQKPNDIHPYIDCDKGWKLTEEDSDFLISFYEDWIEYCIEDCGGDGVEDYTKILNHIKENGVEASKDLIQTDARIMSEAVFYDIYRYYANDAGTLKLIENSILDVQW